MELKDVLSLLGVQEKEDLTLEEVKGQLLEKFVPVDLIKEDERVQSVINATFGKKVGSFETSLKRALKDTLPDFDVTVLSDKKLDEYPDALKAALSSFAEANKTQTDDKLKSKVDDLNAKLQEALQMRDAALNDKTALETEYQGYKTKLQLDTKLNDVWSKVPLSEHASELEKRGFKTEVADRYEFKLPTEDDKTDDGLIVIDKTTGKRPIDGTKYLSAVEVLTDLASQNNLVKKKADTGTPASQLKGKIEQSEDVNKLPYAAKAAQTLAGLQAK